MKATYIITFLSAPAHTFHRNGAYTPPITNGLTIPRGVSTTIYLSKVLFRNLSRRV